MLVDTDIIIWYMRGNQKAYEILNKNKGFKISVVTFMELVQGMRNKEELTLLRKALKNWETKIIYITEEISSKAMFYVEQHYLGHSVQLADALIGATAVAHGEILITANVKHYKIVKEIDLTKFSPE